MPYEDPDDPLSSDIDLTIDFLDTIRDGCIAGLVFLGNTLRNLVYELLIRNNRTPGRVITDAEVKRILHTREDKTLYNRVSEARVTLRQESRDSIDIQRVNNGVLKGYKIDQSRPIRLYSPRITHSFPDARHHNRATILFPPKKRPLR